MRIAIVAAGWARVGWGFAMLGGHTSV